MYISIYKYIYIAATCILHLELSSFPTILSSQCVSVPSKGHGGGKIARGHGFSSLQTVAAMYTWNPNDPCFEWRLGLLLESSNPKIEDISRFQELCKKVMYPMAKLQTFCNCKPLILMDPNGSVKPLGCHGCISQFDCSGYVVFFPGKKWLVVT